MSAEDKIEVLSQQINIGNRKALEKLKQLADVPNRGTSRWIATGRPWLGMSRTNSV